MKRPPWSCARATSVLLQLWKPEFQHTHLPVVKSCLATCTPGGLGHGSPPALQQQGSGVLRDSPQIRHVKALATLTKKRDKIKTRQVCTSGNTGVEATAEVWRDSHAGSACGQRTRGLFGVAHTNTAKCSPSGCLCVSSPLPITRGTPLQSDHVTSVY